MFKMLACNAALRHSLVPTLRYILHSGLVFLVVYVTRLDAQLTWVMAGLYLRTPLNLAYSNCKHKTLTPSTPSAAALKIGVNVQLGATMNISKS
jgi:hypothetical protein